MINNNSSLEIRPQTSDEMQQRQCLKQSFLPKCFTKRIDAFTLKFETYEHCTTTQNTPCFVEYSNEVDISISTIAYTVRTFCHCNMLLLPQVRRNAQHRDRTRRAKTSFRSHPMFRIRSCVFSFGMHSSSRSRTRDTILICGLNHG